LGQLTSTKAATSLNMLHVADGVINEEDYHCHSTKGFYMQNLIEFGQ
jgi:hypothetical protein